MDPLLLSIIWTIILAFVLAVSPGAKSAAQKSMNATKASLTIRSVTPVFDQLVSFPLPNGFMSISQKSNREQFIQEFIPVGETIEKWTQMITLTGHKGLALRQDLSNEFVARQFIIAFQKACPSSFGGVNMGPLKIDSVESYSVVVSCGVIIQRDPTRSESSLIMVVRGQHDIYTLQWSRRGAASQTPLSINAHEWESLRRKLMPIKLCDIKPGEAAPYPSCVN